MLTDMLMLAVASDAVDVVEVVEGLDDKQQQR